MRTPYQILTDGDEAEMRLWVDRQLSGDWFTSELVRLFMKADTSNYAKLAQGFPWEAMLIRWYKDGVHPRRHTPEGFSIEGFSIDEVDAFMKALDD